MDLQLEELEVQGSRSCSWLEDEEEAAGEQKLQEISCSSSSTSSCWSSS